MYQKLKAKFYKEDGNWYLESDVYSKEECQMIQGADVLLSMLTDEDNITLMVCNEHFPTSTDVLDVVNTTEEGWNPYAKSLHEWLRDIKHVHINISPYKSVSFKECDLLWEYEIISLQDLELLSMQDGFTSYEDALNQSLIKIITLI